MYIIRPVRLCGQPRFGLLDDQFMVPTLEKSCKRVRDAIGGGLATGMALIECAEAMASVSPFDGRMQPVTTRDGVAFIRDDFKAPLLTLRPCFEFMKSARTRRKIIVIGEISSVASKKEMTYAKTAILAQEVADITIFVGPWASRVHKTRKPGEQDALHAFSHVRDAANYVNSITREGDLVLLKGTNKWDHLLRAILARSESIACWRDDCRRDSFCNECPYRAKPSGAPTLPPTTTITDTATPFPTPGLGNPEARYSGTPHNVGYEVLDRLAASSGLTWKEIAKAWIARGSSPVRAMCLVKIRLAMNLTGAGLKWLSDSMAFSPAQCILVFDDLDLPLGSVKTRLRGSAGGHRGVASILEAFQTDAFRRVKVGVGQEGRKRNRLDFVLTPFAAESRATIDQAILTAEPRLLEMVKRPSVAQGH